MADGIEAQAQPFFHRGTCKLSATSTTTRGTLLSSTTGGAPQVLIYNAGPDIVYVELGGTSVTATVPTSAGTGSMPVPAYFTVPAFTRDPLTHTSVAAICESGQTATVYISVGTGV